MNDTNELRRLAEAEVFWAFTRWQETLTAEELCATIFDGPNMRNLLSERDALRDRVAELEDALTLVLPMAKGYAHAHPVGGNAAKIASAEAALSQGDQP